MSVGYVRQSSWGKNKYETRPCAQSGRMIFFFFAPHRLRYVEGCSVRMTFSFVLPKVHGCIGTENEAEEEITSIGKIAS